MVFSPSFLLKRLYVQGSLKNVEGGFEFAIQNNITSGSFTGSIYIEVDGTPVDADAILVGKEGAMVKSSELGRSKPFYSNVGEAVQLRVLGEPLEPGSHDIRLTVSTGEIGPIRIPITDTVQ